MAPYGDRKVSSESNDVRDWRCEHQLLTVNIETIKTGQMGAYLLLARSNFDTESFSLTFPYSLFCNA